MYVSDLALNDFRSYREAVIQFQPGVCVLVGDNGRGKTNVVESLAYLSSFSSHRGGADSALVRITPQSNNQPASAVIRAKIATESRDYLLELEIVKGKANRARINRGAVAPREIIGLLRTVVFAPEDLQIIRAEPALRRRFIDEMIIQMKPVYASVRSDFERVLKQRGATLKYLGAARRRRETIDLSMIQVWNESLVRLSAQIAAHRLSVLSTLAPASEDVYRQVADDDKTFGLDYRGTWLTSELRKALTIPIVDNGYISDVSELADQLAPAIAADVDAQQDQEIIRGVNLVGAHRDDIEMRLNHLPVKGFASHGETWSVALSLRLAQLRVLERDQDSPLLILDDVFAELDSRRRLALVEVIEKTEQVFITAAVPEDIPGEIQAVSYRVSYHLEEGSTLVKLFDGEDDV